jgi:hypothetical protein
VRRPGERRGDALGGVAADLAVGREQPRERSLERHGPSSSSTVIAELCSSNSRVQALAAGDRLLGEDLLLGLGEQMRPVAARRAQVVARRSPAVGGSSASAFSSSSAAHSSSKNSSLVSIAVPFSW